MGAGRPVADDLTGIGAALRAVFPNLGTITPVGLLGVGFGSVAVETAEGLVFRIARDRVGAEGHARELRLLPRLQAWVPVAIPNPRVHTGPSQLLPFGAMGYAKLPGRTLLPELLPVADVAAIAAGIAAFLLALHQFPTEEAGRLGLPGPEGRWRELELLRDDTLPPLRAALTVEEMSTVERWWDAFLADRRMRRFRPGLVHGDLWYENLLVDDALRHLVGVIDFGDAAVGDPAQDFATLLHLGEPFAACVAAAYRAGDGTIDEDFSHRLRRLWELREFDGVGFAVRHEPVEFEEAVGKLRAGPILSPGVHRGVGPRSTLYPV